MRKVYAGLGAALIIVLSGAVAAVAAPGAETERATSGAGICQKTTFEAPGGYFSMGSFYSDSGATATIDVDWCYSGGRITSHHVSFKTTITPSQGLLTKTVSLDPGKSKLSVAISGTFATGILNNTGVITIAGSVDGSGASNFANLSSAGG